MTIALSASTATCNLRILPIAAFSRTRARFSCSFFSASNWTRRRELCSSRVRSLNARCNGHLIETDQRENLCDLINRGAGAAGVGAGADLTAAWREW